MSYYCTADWHGGLNGFRAFVESAPQLTENDTVFILGDVGLHYGQYVQGQLKKAMKKLPCTWVVIRGNHDKRYEKFGATQGVPWQRNYWHGLKVSYQRKYSNILYLPDAGGKLSIGPRTVLVVPGAYSIDKEYRLRKCYPWEPDEQLTMAEAENLISLAKVEHPSIILSHDCPKKWHPELQDLFLDFDHEEDYFTNQVCDSILDVDFNLQKWYFGHYHKQRTVGDGLGQMVYHSCVPIAELNGD